MPDETPWDEWLAVSLTAMHIDADVFGPYVTGIMVRGRASQVVMRQAAAKLHGVVRAAAALIRARLRAGLCAGGRQPAGRGARKQRGAQCAVSHSNPFAAVLTLCTAQLELLQEASPTGTVEVGTVERLTQRWQDRCRIESAAAAAAEEALLAKYAAQQAAQRCVCSLLPACGI